MQEKNLLSGHCFTFNVDRFHGYKKRLWVIHSENENNAVLIITHSTKILKYLDVDYVHILSDGQIILSGDRSLAHSIEENGYSSYINNEN